MSGNIVQFDGGGARTEENWDNPYCIVDDMECRLRAIRNLAHSIVLVAHSSLLEIEAEDSHAIEEIAEQIKARVRELETRRARAYHLLNAQQTIAVRPSRSRRVSS